MKRHEKIIFPKRPNLVEVVQKVEDEVDRTRTLSNMEIIRLFDLPSLNLLSHYYLKAAFFEPLQSSLSYSQNFDENILSFWAKFFVKNATEYMNFIKLISNLVLFQAQCRHTKVKTFPVL